MTPLHLRLLMHYAAGRRMVQSSNAFDGAAHENLIARKLLMRRKMGNDAPITYQITQLGKEVAERILKAASKIVMRAAPSPWQKFADAMMADITRDLTAQGEATFLMTSGYGDPKHATAAERRFFPLDIAAMRPYGPFDSSPRFFARPPVGKPAHQTARESVVGWGGITPKGCFPDERYSAFELLGDLVVGNKRMTNRKWKHVFDIVFARTDKLRNGPLAGAIYHQMAQAVKQGTDFETFRRLALETLVGES